MSQTACTQLFYLCKTQRKYSFFDLMNEDKGPFMPMPWGIQFGRVFDKSDNRKAVLFMTKGHLKIFLTVSRFSNFSEL